MEETINQGGVKMETIKKVRRASRSKTINWGHIQVIAGTVAASLGFITPQTMPDLPAYVYGIALMIAGAITYALRAVTRKPLDEK
jgi:hypothetical protein